MLCHETAFLKEGVILRGRKFGCVASKIKGLHILDKNQLEILHTFQPKQQSKRALHNAVPNRTTAQVELHAL